MSSNPFLLFIQCYPQRMRLHRRLSTEFIYSLILHDFGSWNCKLSVFCQIIWYTIRSMIRRLVQVLSIHSIPFAFPYNFNLYKSEADHMNGRYDMVWYGLVWFAHVNDWLLKEVFSIDWVNTSCQINHSQFHSSVIPHRYPFIPFPAGGGVNLTPL